MSTARQSRAARALLGWTQETLADKARISLTALKRLESENVPQCVHPAAPPFLSDNPFRVGPFSAVTLVAADCVGAFSLARSAPCGRTASAGIYGMIKSERHHWWPECVSRHWADANGNTHLLRHDGETICTPPKNLGVIRNGHIIKFSGNPAIGDPWDESYEGEFQQDDNNFPEIIDWLNTLDRCDPPFERTFKSRILPQPVDSERLSVQTQSDD